jgi:hypothetical protein
MIIGDSLKGDKLVYVKWPYAYNGI